MNKLYCYIDESGQDTFAHPSRQQIFVVGLVTLMGDQGEFRQLCEDYETISQKHVLKWSKAEHKARMRFLRLIFADDRFRGALRYSVFRTISRNEFPQSTQLAIANAIRSVTLPDTPFTVNAEIYVDGLSKANRRKWGAALKERGIFGHTVHSVLKDENNPLIRLADTLAGFIRDTVEIDTTEFRLLKERGKDQGVLIEV